MVNKNQEPNRDPAKEVPLNDTVRYFLAALIESSPQRGYRLLKNAIRLSEGVVSPGVGNAYTAFGRWVEKGFIDKQEVTDRERRETAMYAITDYGKAVFDEDLKFVTRTSRVLTRIRKANP